MRGEGSNVMPGQAMREALARKHDWESHGQGHWGYGVAVDLLALERRVAAIEQGNRPEKTDSSRDDSPGDGWRWVEAGEALMDGDEYIGSDGGWRKSQLLGQPCEDEHAYRRRIDAKSNHDAAPAARAHEPEPEAARRRPAGGTGDTQEPVAWAALNDDGDIAWIGYTEEGAADGSSGRAIVPLYRSPTLTDEEREAIEAGISACEDIAYGGATDQEAADTMRRLLDRLK